MWNLKNKTKESIHKTNRLTDRENRPGVTEAGRDKIGLIDTHHYP